MKTNKIKVNGIEYDIEDAKARELLKILTGNSEESIDGRIEIAITEETQRAEEAERLLSERIDNFDLSEYYTKEEVNTELNKKQETISDLSSIREGASKGATAIQSGELESAVNTEKTRAEKAEKALGERIDNIDFPEVDLSGYYTIDEINTKLTEKQNTIEDLSNIREGAAKGATAIQQETLESAINVEKLRAEGVEETLNDRIDAYDSKNLVTLEDTKDEIEDIPDYITRDDLVDAINEAITNTINTPV